MAPAPSPEPAAPDDLARAMRRVKGATSRWRALPPSHRREWIRYLDEARQPATRARRVAKTAAQLGAEAGAAGAPG